MLDEHEEIDVSDTDEYGRNDECGRCHDLGREPLEVRVNPILNEASRGDWFCFEGHDDGFFFLHEAVTVELSNIPERGNYDIVLYHGDCGGLVELARSEVEGSDSERLRWPASFT